MASEKGLVNLCVKQGLQYDSIEGKTIDKILLFNIIIFFNFIFRGRHEVGVKL